MSNLHTNRSVLVFAVSAVMLIAWTLLIFIPNRRETKAYELRSAELETELQQLHALFLSAGQSAEQSEEAENQTSRALAQLMPVDSLEHFIDIIERRLTQFGLQEITIAPGVEAVLRGRTVIVGDQQLLEVLLRTTLIGRYIEIGQALEYLENQSYFSEFRFVNLGYDDELNPAIGCQFDLTVYLKSTGVTP